MSHRITAARYRVPMLGALLLVVVGCDATGVADAPAGNLLVFLEDFARQLLAAYLL